MQTGISMDEYEIRELIRQRIACETDVDPDELEVHVTCWNGRLSTCTTYAEGNRNLSLKESPQ